MIKWAKDKSQGQSCESLDEPDYCCVKERIFVNPQIGSLKRWLRLNELIVNGL